MADRSEHLAAFEEIASELHRAAAANAHALRTHRNTPAGTVVERQLEHTLDRLALLYGRGTYENLHPLELFETAVANEIALAHESDAAGTAGAADHIALAQNLIDAARRGVRLNIRSALPVARPRRGAYIAPLRPELRIMLHQQREPYIGWRDGIVAALPEEDLAALRAEGDEVDILFLDADEMLDLNAREDQAAFEAELARRLAAARAAPDHVGDSRERHLQRRLQQQSTLLRNLRERLAAEHPAAHKALHPVVAQNRVALENALTDAPFPTALGDPLNASIDHERRLQALVARWAAEPDDFGFGIRFSAVANAGTHLDELERHRR